MCEKKGTREEAYAVRVSVWVCTCECLPMYEREMGDEGEMGRENDRERATRGESEESASGFTFWHTGGVFLPEACDARHAAAGGVRPGLRI